jgi:hypothetical protein
LLGVRLPDADAGPPDGRPKSNATQVIPAPASNPAVETAVQNPPETIQRSPARYLWVMLLARIYEALPLTCPQYGAEMRIIKHAHGQLENSSPTSSGRPISAARAAAAQKRLLFALDSTLGAMGYCGEGGWTYYPSILDENEEISREEKTINKT